MTDFITNRNFPRGPVDAPGPFADHPDKKRAAEVEAVEFEAIGPGYVPSVFPDPVVAVRHMLANCFARKLRNDEERRYGVTVFGVNYDGQGRGGDSRSEMLCEEFYFDYSVEEARYFARTGRLLCDPYAADVNAKGELLP
ncbi:hypothetical protein [Alienimonas sp. DA493]|uniref:hypothetical protein n=1 Tax=Alienimonas sp. DA493 TaxID=3373605 RepID=UPI0037545433